MAARLISDEKESRLHEMVRIIIIGGAASASKEYSFNTAGNRNIGLD